MGASIVAGIGITRLVNAAIRFGAVAGCDIPSGLGSAQGISDNPLFG